MRDAAFIYPAVTRPISSLWRYFLDWGIHHQLACEHPSGRTNPVWTSREVRPDAGNLVVGVHASWRRSGLYSSTKERVLRVSWIAPELTVSPVREGAPPSDVHKQIARLRLKRRQKVAFCQCSSSSRRRSEHPINGWDVGNTVLEQRGQSR